jgi:hypothetical protein
LTNKINSGGSNHNTKNGKPSRQDAHNDKEEDSQDRATKRTANATVCIAIFTVVAAFVGISQFIVLRGQLNVMQRQLTEMQSPSADRPYLFVAHDDREPASNPVILEPGTIYRVLFKNYGKTPAVYRGFYPRCGYSLTLPPRSQYPTDRWASTVLVGPSETIGPFDCPLLATKEEIRLAQSGVGYLLMAAKIKYDDLSGLSHETEFCMVYKPSTKQFGLTPNDASCNHCQ